VEGFEDAHVVGLTPEHQKKNFHALKRLISMAHQRGLDFTLGIWDHIYRGGVQRGPLDESDSSLRWRVSGLTTENLMEYNKAALKELLHRFPDIDAIQFRMHGESGLKKDEMDIFWGGIYDIMLRHGSNIRFDARVKGFPDRLIDMALEKGVNIRLCTKYWMEQMGLPFHPTHINPQNQMDRRHGYADLLRYPQKYKMHWRLWNGGTSRVLLWGDPDYAKGFAQSTHLYDGEGFDVNEPLATKMAGHGHDMEPFELLNPEYKYYNWEFQRYWHFFQVFGRVGYNPETPSDIWEKEFEKRFGKKAGIAIMEGLHLASKILPRIVAYSYPYNLFPTTRGWIEKQRMEDLPNYAKAKPSDTQQFLSIDDAAKNLVTGNESAKIHPMKNSRWFARVSEKVLAIVNQAEENVEKKSNEFISTVADLKILAGLALYHSKRIYAGLNWALFQHTKSLKALDNAIHYEKQAVDAWKGIVEAAGDIYSDNLMMGVPKASLSGHWKDELIALESGLKALQEQKKSFKTESGQNDLQFTQEPDTKILFDTGSPTINHVPITIAEAGKPLTIKTEVKAPSGIKWVRLRFRSVTQFQDFQTIEMLPTDKKSEYQAVVPGDYLDPKWDFMYLIEAMNNDGNGCIYPDLEKETPYIIVRLER